MAEPTGPEQPGPDRRDTVLPADPPDDRAWAAYVADERNRQAQAVARELLVEQGEAAPGHALALWDTGKAGDTEPADDRECNEYAARLTAATKALYALTGTPWTGDPAGQRYQRARTLAVAALSAADHAEPPGAHTHQADPEPPHQANTRGHLVDAVLAAADALQALDRPGGLTEARVRIAAGTYDLVLAACALDGTPAETGPAPEPGETSPDSGGDS